MTLTAVLLAATPVSADYMDHFVVREDVGPRKVPSLGDSQLLLIPVEVKGFPPFDRTTLEYFFSPDAPRGFVQYYQTASLGRYRPRVTVAPTVSYDTCPLPQPQFADCAIGRNDLTAISAGKDMMRDVLRRTKAAGVDFTRFDVNGKAGVPDGWADGVMLLANVPFGGIAFPIAFFNQEDNLAGGTSGPLILDGIKIPHLAIAGFLDNYVMVHEFGHLLGLTDLYDESGKYNGLAFTQMGAWYYDPKIPLPDAETRLRLRWAEWRQVQGTQRVTVRPAELSGDVWRLGTGDEYFLVENRGPGLNFDLSFTGRGLAVFKVDRTVKLKGQEGAFVSRILDCVNCDPWRPFLRNVQADGKFEIQDGKRAEMKDLYADGASLVPDPSNTPLGPQHRVESTNLYSGAQTGLSITDVRVLPSGEIEATLTAPASGQCGDALCAEGVGCKPVSCGEVAPPPKSGCAVAPGGPGLALALLLLLRARRRGGRATAS